MGGGGGGGRKLSSEPSVEGVLSETAAQVVARATEQKYTDNTFSLRLHSSSFKVDVWKSRTCSNQHRLLSGSLSVTSRTGTACLAQMSVFDEVTLCSFSSVKSKEHGCTGGVKLKAKKYFCSMKPANGCHAHFLSLGQSAVWLGAPLECRIRF